MVGIALNRIITRDQLGSGGGGGGGAPSLNIGIHLERLLQATGAAVPWDANHSTKIGGQGTLRRLGVGSTGAQARTGRGCPCTRWRNATLY